MSVNHGLGIFGIFAGFGIFILLIVLLNYLLLAIGLYTLAKRRNIEHAWLAWIPAINLYIVGAIVKEVRIGDTTIPRLDLILPIAAIVSPMLFIPIIGWLLGIAIALLTTYSYYLLFKQYVPDQAVLFIILSIITGSALLPIFVFIIRNKDSVEVI